MDAEVQSDPAVGAEASSYVGAYGALVVVAAAAVAAAGTAFHGPVFSLDDSYTHQAGQDKALLGSANLCGEIPGDGPSPRWLTRSWVVMLGRGFVGRCSLGSHRGQ